MTRNEAVVGVTFNRSQKHSIAQIKEMALVFMNYLDNAPVPEFDDKLQGSETPLTPEYGRWISLAKTHIETAAMYAVKAMAHNQNAR